MLSQRPSGVFVKKTQPVTTNFMGPFPALDYWKWAAEVDVVSDDNYPDPRDPHAARDAALARDLMRSLKPGVPWLLMEQAPSAVQYRPRNAGKAPGQMAAWSEQAVARGAGSVLFFQWRQSRAGQEKFHSAMYPQSGRESRTWAEIVRLGAALDGRPVARPPAGDVGIVLDWDNLWALTQPDLPADVDYLAEIRRWYGALFDAHVQTAFTRPDADLSGFKLVVAPPLYLLTEESAAALTDYVRGGGVLVTTAYTDIVDATDRFRPGGYGTQLAPVLGGHPIDFFGVEEADGRLVLADDGAEFPLTTVEEDFVVTTGTVLARTDEGAPAVVLNEFGAGSSLHAASLPGERLTGWLLDLALRRAGVAPVQGGLPVHVEAIDTGAGVTLINHSGEATALDGLTLAPFEARRR